MRLASLKAFVRFLIESGVVHPEVLSKRMTIKVCERGISRWQISFYDKLYERGDRISAISLRK